jgi:hypothetical protein
MEMEVEQMMACLLSEIRTNQEMLSRMETKIDINLKEIRNESWSSTPERRNAGQDGNQDKGQ